MGVISSEVSVRRQVGNASIQDRQGHGVKNNVVSSPIATALAKKGKKTQTEKKAVSFDDHENIQEYDASDFDPVDVYSQSFELEAWRTAAIETVRTNHEKHPEYRERVLQAFRRQNYRYTEDDLDKLGESVCRGLERKLSKIFITHRQWTVNGLLKMQDIENNHECMRFFSKRASQPCVDFAKMLAVADRRAADRIYGEDELFTLSSHSTNYWSDSSRSLESADTIDTI
jgi:hypothetical protein